MEPLKRIVDFAHGHDTLIGIQLAHAGRKASTLALWLNDNYPLPAKSSKQLAYEDENGWPDEGLRLSVIL